MSESIESEKCAVWVASGDRSPGHRCNRPVESDGKCKMHIGVARRRAERYAEWDRKREQDGARRQSAQEIADRLAAFGIVARPDWSSMGNSYTGGVSLDAVAAKRLLELLDARP